MSIKELKVSVKKHPRNYKYYGGVFIEKEGYYTVPIESLSLGSKVKVTRICDGCGGKSFQPYKNILKYRKNGKDYCWVCGNNTEEALKNKGDSHRGYTWSEESKEKTRKSHLGKKLSEGTKAKIKYSVSKTMNTESWKEWYTTHYNKNYSLGAYISKYGEIEGASFFRSKVQVKSKFSLEYWIEKHNGDIEEATKEYKIHQTRNKNYFSLKYGDVEGEKKYEEWNKKKCTNNKNRFSRSSQSFISDIISHFNIKNKVYHGENEFIFYLCSNERQLLNNETNIFCVDFYDKDANLVIEYDGDYWHSFEKQKKHDESRDTILKNRGLNVVRIKESEYLKDRDSVIKTIGGFYENY